MKGFVLSPRNAGHLFGEDVVKEFNYKNNLEVVYRAHQLIMDGYRQMFSNLLVIIWSAPNYCYRLNNNAAILEIDENLQKYYKVYEAAPQVTRHHPPFAIFSRA